MENIVSVKDAEGRHFAPGYAEDLAEWDWTQSYVVYANRALSIEVSGTPIEPDAEIALRAGLNSVSYTHPYPMPVEEAFAELTDVLDYVEDGEGRRYPAEAGRGALHQLEPGRGYRVRLSANATLRYPTEPKSFDGDIDVNTMAEALALTGLQPGQTVGVAGYYRPGDGGGGLFEVRNSGAATDGGLVFVPNEFVSGEVGEGFAYGGNGVYRFRELPDGERVVFGTLALVLNNPTETDPFAFDGIYLHGHRYASSRPRQPFFDYEAGQFQDDQVFHRYFQGKYGDRRNGRIWFTYRHTTSRIRLHRLDIGETLNTHWFGIRPAAEGTMWTGGTDVQPLLSHVVNVAAALNEATPGRIQSVLLPALDTYDYYGSIELSEGLTLRGQAGTELVTVTNDLGHTYQPVRFKEQHTRLRVMDGEAFKGIRMEKDPSDPFYLEPDLKQILDGRQTNISPEPNVMAFGVEDIIFDGNWENNLGAWEEGWATDKELKAWAQDSPAWAAVSASAHKGKRIPQGQQVTIRNVGITGYASNGLLGNANNTWTVTNLRAGDTLWNHVVYSANGTYTNLTFDGFAWGHAAWGYGEIYNLVFEDGEPAPVRTGYEIMGIRGGDAYDPSELAGRDGYFTREDGTVPADLGTFIEGFYLDLRGSEIQAPFNGVGPNIVIRGRSAAEPGRIVTNGNGRGLFHEGGNGYQKALYPNNQFEHILIYDQGGGRDQTLGRASLTDAVLTDVRTETLSGGAGLTNSSLHLYANWRDHPAWDAPQVIEINDLVERSPHQFIAKVDVHERAAGLTVRIRNSSFANTTNTLLRGPNGTGKLEAFPGDLSKIRVLMEGTEFNIYDDKFEELDLFFAMVRLQACTDRRSGNTSEASGQLVIESGGGRTVDIPTTLLWRPLNPDAIQVSSSISGLIEEVQVIPRTTNAEDWRAPIIRVSLVRALAVGERVTLDWSAAVRPFEP